MRSTASAKRSKVPGEATDVPCGKAKRNCQRDLLSFTLGLMGRLHGTEEVRIQKKKRLEVMATRGRNVLHGEAMQVSVVIQPCSGFHGIVNTVRLLYSPL